jgi:hypothetical protein
MNYIEEVYDEKGKFLWAGPYTLRVAPRAIGTIIRRGNRVYQVQDGCRGLRGDCAKKVMTSVKLIKGVE